MIVSSYVFSIAVGLGPLVKCSEHFEVDIALYKSSVILGFLILCIRSENIISKQLIPYYSYCRLSKIIIKIGPCYGIDFIIMLISMFGFNFSSNFERRALFYFLSRPVKYYGKRYSRT